MSPVTQGEQREISRRRHREILDAAAAIFHDQGYEGTSIQDVADAVGILKGSLYYYIDSKEDLLFGVIEDVHREGLTLLEQWRASEGDALSKLRGFITGHVLQNIANRVKVRVFFQDFRSLSDARRKIIVEERDRYDQYLRELIRQGQKDGTIAADVDPTLTAFGILGMMNWTYQWYHPEGPSSPQDVAQQFADLVLGGLVADGRATPRSELGAPGGDA